MTVVDLPKPTIKVQYGSQSMSAYYDTGIKKQEGNQEWRIFLVITTRYTKAGINYFTGERRMNNVYQTSVRNEAHRGGITRSMMGTGKVVLKHEGDFKRFVRSKLHEFFDCDREKIEEILSVEPHHLERWEQLIREPVHPYALGLMPS